MATGIQRTELFLKYQKEIIALGLLVMGGIGATGGYFARDVFPESKVVVSKQTVPMVAKPSCDENVIARICGKVVRSHESGRLH